MLIEFEDITENINPKGIDCQLIDKVEHLIRTSKMSPISNKMLRQFLDQYYQIKVGAPKIRAVIHYLRVSGRIKLLLSNSHGYYIATSSHAANVYIESLRQRQRSINAVIEALRRQTAELY